MRQDYRHLYPEDGSIELPDNLVWFSSRQAGHPSSQGPRDPSKAQRTRDHMSRATAMPHPKGEQQRAVPGSPPAARELDRGGTRDDSPPSPARGPPPERRQSQRPPSPANPRLPKTPGPAPPGNHPQGRGQATPHPIPPTQSAGMPARPGAPPGHHGRHQPPPTAPRAQTRSPTAPRRHCHPAQGVTGYASIGPPTGDVEQGDGQTTDEGRVERPTDWQRGGGIGRTTDDGRVDRPTDWRRGAGDGRTTDEGRVD
ncbi:Hypothetical protein SMAX5B_010980 [Scophthalmus maximus]|uniref:Uncharacterized protein n=1 Tax=Scophthalmus maximus TaxID=52904 RepID=A0A2U9BR46_SCOMX|nr:Hypothetical protein SMAX5B_010980 [Scophthalmus maximus]